MVVDDGEVTSFGLSVEGERREELGPEEWGDTRLTDNSSLLS